VSDGKDSTDVFENGFVRSEGPRLQLEIRK